MTLNTSDYRPAAHNADSIEYMLTTAPENELNMEEFRTARTTKTTPLSTRRKFIRQTPRSRKPACPANIVKEAFAWSANHLGKVFAFVKAKVLS